ncbi:hypothetical protein ACFXPA_44125 [Amycolatopsis sp. NPDC059090]|uniref:hypothetical protein n=1 Tax=unclassified Amycolatopsis TaxID=2618356 RepID=UPI00367215B2
MSAPHTPDPGGLAASPGEVSSLISESARLLPWHLLGTAVFGALSWFSSAVAWLHAAAAVAAIVVGLRGLCHAVFLFRAALRFRDELDLAIEQAEADAARLRSLTADDPYWTVR